jgi:predicted nuclease of predicted toxin-antitoxin system
MKFLVDAQLPKSLSDFLIVKGFDSIHTIDLVKKNRTSDASIIRIVTDESRIVVTKDVDFLNSHLIKRLPEKLIMVKTGNISNKQLIEIFDKNLDLIIRMIKHSNLVEVNQNFIAERRK